MSYDILGDTGKNFSCNNWGFYLDVAEAFGWKPAGAFVKCDEGGFGEHPSGSYLGNDWQKVTQEDASNMAAALNLAVATINAGGPLSDAQVRALAGFAKFDGDHLMRDYGPLS